MTTTSDTREGLLQQAREIAARHAPGAWEATYLAGGCDNTPLVQVALAALSTATTPVDGEAKMREALAKRGCAWTEPHITAAGKVIGRKLVIGFENHDHADEALEALASTRAPS